MSAAAGAGSTSGAKQRKLHVYALAIAALILPLTANTSPALAQSSTQQGLAKLKQGTTALLRKQYREADRLLSEAVNASGLPTEARAMALGHRGIARTRSGVLRPAIHDFNAAVILTPEDATLYNNRGNLLLEIGLYTEAAKDFDQAIALAPDYGAAYSNRGNALILLGDSAEAVADFDRAIALMPLSPVPFNGRARAQLALGRPAGALRDLNRAIALNSRYGQAYANRAEALIAIHRYPEAASDYGAAIAFGVDTPDSYRRRAALYAALQMPARALADLEEARKRDPAGTAEIEPVLLGGDPSPADETVTGALPAEAERVAANDGSACVDEQTSSLEPAARLYKLGEAPQSAPPELLHLVGNAPAASKLASTPATYRIALNCASAEDREPEPLAQIAAAEGDDQYALAAQIWRIKRIVSDVYVAENPRLPGFSLRLEMYGAGEPELLHWQELGDPLAGVGLLHYFAGVNPRGGRLEYVAIIDIARRRLLAIEPASVGEKRAAWSWGETSLLVVSPDGVPSTIALDGQLPAELRLSGRLPEAKQGKRSLRVAKRFRPKASSQVKHKSRKGRGYRDYADAKRLPPRFRQRGYPGAYDYKPPW